MTAKSWSSNHDPSSFNRPFVLPDRPVFCACPWRLHGRPRSLCRRSRLQVINGVEVWRECWNYQTTRHCTSSSTVDYCSGLKQTPGCRQTKAECLSYSLTGTCMSWNSTYICSEEAKETENIEILDSSHTVISGTDTTTCSSFLDNPDCYIAEEKCIEGPETRIINGVAVYKECWKKELAFACAAPGASNSCKSSPLKAVSP